MCSFFLPGYGKKERNIDGIKRYRRREVVMKKVSGDLNQPQRHFPLSIPTW